jgi:transposase
MGRIQTWEVSDVFWELVEPLIPRKERDAEREYKRGAGAGRKPLSPRQVFAGIVYVLRTGMHWKALPKERFGSPSAIHRYFLEWQAAGFFDALWQRGLAEYDDLEGIAWQWQAADGAMMKAPMGQEAVGKNPTDRGKKWQQAHAACGRAWRPVRIDRVRCQPA